MIGLSILIDFSSIVEDVGHKLIPNWISFVVQVAALVIMILVIFFVAYKPVKKMLKKRQDYVVNNIKEAEANKILSEKNIKQANELVIASKKEASEIISNAKREAQNIAAKEINESIEQIRLLKIQAEKDIEQSRLEALEDIRKEIVGVALDASNEILKREVNEEDNKRVIEDFIKDMK